MLSVKNPSNKRDNPLSKQLMSEKVSLKASVDTQESNEKYEFVRMASQMAWNTKMY